MINVIATFAAAEERVYANKLMIPWLEPQRAFQTPSFSKKLGVFLERRS